MAPPWQGTGKRGDNPGLVTFPPPEPAGVYLLQPSLPLDPLGFREGAHVPRIVLSPSLQNPYFSLTVLYSLFSIAYSWNRLDVVLLCNVSAGTKSNHAALLVSKVITSSQLRTACQSQIRSNHTSSCDFLALACGKLVPFEHLCFLRGLHPGYERPGLSRQNDIGTTRLGEWKHNEDPRRSR